jgi:hypothetical protein
MRSQDAARLVLLRSHHEELPMTTRLPLLLAILLGACSPSEGDACEGGGECTGPSEALLCLGGELRRTPCRGPEACTTEGERVRCDRSLAEAGDPCAGASACSLDSSSFLVCREGRLMVGAECPAGCEVDGDRVRCAHPELQPPLE